MSNLDHLLCPIDQQPLTRSGRSLVCLNNHSFDIAKSGYVNLLPVQNKHSKDPGDSKAMVSARQDFLMSGLYDPILTGILESMPTVLKQRTLFSMLDAGCGEGYYLNWLKRQSEHQIDAVGVDISKWAITSASKKSKQIDWVVGSNAHLPMPDGRFDCVMCAFGFPIVSEFHRVLSDDGWLLLVESGERHLIELRKVLYPEIRPYQSTFADGMGGFQLQFESSVEFSFTLETQQSIANLLSMTPHIHKAPYEGREAVLALESIGLTGDVRLRWYRKQGKLEC